jgi:hypothetical protein
MATTTTMMARRIAKIRGQLEEGEKRNKSSIKCM